MSEEPLPAVVYASLFEGNPNGVKVLEELIRVFSRSAVTRGGIDAILQTYHNNGARSVVEFIVNKINVAHVGIPEGEDDAT